MFHLSINRIIPLYLSMECSLSRYSGSNSKNIRGERGP